MRNMKNFFPPKQIDRLLTKNKKVIFFHCIYDIQHNVLESPRYQTCVGFCRYGICHKIVMKYFFKI
ncbi:hypothetical protein PR048_003273 [Dryococelus australis]|uniref:Uncharacterized protein n=1 Tax=Dryococelus australis TaxID=614101 RepID=A0ABQ9IMK1_9NEOP|nr:hypothetical protein PR048_003273 [Dryococelus australis]